MTLAPPPATIVQIRPFGLRTVNFKDALVCKKIKKKKKLNFTKFSLEKIGEKLVDKGE